MLHRSSDYYENNEQNLAQIVHFYPEIVYFIEANPMDRYSSIVRIGSTDSCWELEVSNEFIDALQFETDVEFRFVDRAA